MDGGFESPSLRHIILSYLFSKVYIEEAAPAAARRKQPWPAAIPDQFRVVKDAMRSAAPQTPQWIAAGFRPAPRTRVAEILATLTALGQARESTGRYSL